MSQILDDCSIADVPEQRFPPEIEYQIFVFAFDCKKGRRTRLLTVAKRVFEWLIPLLYEVIILEKHTSCPPIETLRTYGHHVHTLCMFDLSSQAEKDAEILSSCVNISRLAYFSPQYRPEVLCLPLTELSARDCGHIKLYVDALSQTPPLTGINQDWCTNITHLSIVWDDGIHKTVLSSFPSLTHFRSFEYNSSETVRYALEHSPKLEVLIWVLDPSEFRVDPPISPSATMPLDDIRVVRMEDMDDWDVGWNGETVWVVAEREIEQRKARIAGISNT